MKVHGITHRHVALTPNVSLRQRPLKLPRHSEVTQLHFTLLVNEDVRRLDI